jgi:hypothetical protein
MTSTALASVPQVTIGVDTHKHFHVAHAADELGRPGQLHHAHHQHRLRRLLGLGAAPGRSAWVSSRWWGSRVSATMGQRWAGPCALSGYGSPRWAAPTGSAAPATARPTY